jgi:phenylalanyl-tRNA synthetase beta chain
MLVSLNWIREFVKVPSELDAKDIGLRLTMGTAEVEEVLSIGKFWEEIVVAEITHIEKHPEADKLNLVTFKKSEDSSFRVVCGASNVRVGLKTAFAPIGTTLPIGLTLEPRKIRGILSEGMLCSEEELALKDKSAGIIEFPDDAPLGQSLKDYWSKSTDILFDIDNKSLTHRPDLWGHFGMAREFAALFGSTLEDRFHKEWERGFDAKFTSADAPIKVQMEEDSAGILYSGISMDGVTVGESPAWMQDRLINVGLRPINNIVDVSNYVMLELGMPLHIFDRKKIKGDTLSVETVKEATSFQTLDEEQRSLVVGDTVISDESGALVIGGIMGGLSSGVTESTKEIFIEVANWKAAKVRKTSTRLGLRTDSSMRYEKTLDSNLCHRTLLRTIELILELCPGSKVVGKPQYAGVDLSQQEGLVIDISLYEICSVLGKELLVGEVSSILESLDFGVEKKDGALSVTVPSYRATKDIDCSADLIEEIGRIIGYDNITPIGPLLDVSPVRLSPLHSLKRKVQDFLSLEAKCLEVNTYPLIGSKLLKKCSWADLAEDLKLVNSLAAQNDRMRPSLIPSFLEVAALNQKNFDQSRFFELGRTYVKGEKSFAKEDDILGICFYSKKESPFLELVSACESLCKYSNIPSDFIGAHPKFKNNLVDEEWSGVHPVEFLNARIMGKMDGVVFSIHPLMLKKFKIKGHLSFAFFNLSAVTSKPLKEKVGYKPLAKYPGSRFDYTVTLTQERSVDEIFSSLQKVKIKECVGHEIVDVFTPENGKERHVTMRSLFQDPEKTLPGEFIKECEEKIISGLKKVGIELKSS